MAALPKDLKPPTMDFSNILAYPPAEFAGIVVLRLADQAHVAVQAAIRRLLDLRKADLGQVWLRGADQ
jgi:hypothetical protein